MKQVTTKQIGIIIALTLGLVLAFSPVQKSKVFTINAEKISGQIIERSDHITAEQLGHLIIDKDPDYQLIDLRNPTEYEKFHIETAINIPLETLFSEKNIEYVDPEKLVILYTNGGTHAAQAWVLLQQMGYENTTVLLGGLNYWVDIYSNPQPPQGVYADSEIFNYEFHVSAGKHFMGNIEATGTAADKVEPAKIKLPKRKKKVKAADEGC